MEKVTATEIKNSKDKKQKISVLTAYDYPIAKILDEAGIDIVLVGDSLGNVALGYKRTRWVTMSDMIRHTIAVAKGVKHALIITDMPFASMRNVRQAIKNAKALMKVGAEGVKVEGIKELKAIKMIIKHGIPVMGHLGCLPQTARKFRIQHSRKIVKQAKLLEKAGVFAIVLELVDPELAREITRAIKVPTIGIGSGPNCDGQVLVTYDLLGLSPKAPKHAKKYIDLSGLIKKAVQKFITNLKKTN
jgi:3-methyl-2-oxobutanoate hydroxymethyltransferase